MFILMNLIFGVKGSGYSPNGEDENGNQWQKDIMECTQTN